MRGWPSVTKASPARSGKTQLSTRLARAARYVNRIHLSKGLGGAGFRAGAEQRSQRQPGVVPGRGVHGAPPSASGASAGGSLKPTSGWGAPSPLACTASLAPLASAGAPDGSGAQMHRTDSGLASVLSSAFRPPPGPSSCWPGLQGAILPPRAGPSPGAGPRQALPARRAPCFPRQVRNGRARGDPSPHGGAAAATLLLQPPPPGSRGVVTGAGTLGSGLAARLLKGVRSGGSRRRCCH